MQIRHEGQPLATQVDVARSRLAKLRGLMFRRAVPPNYGLVFEFDRVARRSVHMLFVRTPLDVLWVANDHVTKQATLRAWTGFSWGRADTIIELAPGATTAVDEGDWVTVAASD